LRIFEFHYPRLNPCDPISDTNPAIEAVYENFLSYKNKRNGAIGTKLGKVIFRNFTVIDNQLAGVENEFGEVPEGGATRFEDIYIIGESQGNSEYGIAKMNPETFEVHSNIYDTAGVITPRSEGFIASNIFYINFKRQADDSSSFKMKGITTCSHCFNACVRDSGARLALFEKVHWDHDNPNMRKTSYFNPFNGII
jgi:hypothetical protein